MPSYQGRSVFSYPLTRPYPFLWFTWAVVVGGVAATVLFTFIALASNGYDVVSEYKTDLNATLQEKYWFQKAPFSWVQKLQITCESALLIPGVTYSTSSLGLRYVLDAVWQEETDGRLTWNLPRPAAPYRGELLEDCSVRQIHINFQRTVTSSRLENWWGWLSTTSKATITCTIRSPDLGPVQLNFTTQLPQVQDSIQIPQTLLSLDITSRPDMWFGAWFLYSWYGQLSPALSFSQPSASDSWDSGTVDLARNPKTDDYTNLAFFTCGPRFPMASRGLAWMDSQNRMADWANQWVPTWVPQDSTDGKHRSLGLPNISITVDVFAKTFYSLILSDLGIMDRSNALITPEGITYLQTRNDTDLVAAAMSVGNSGFNGQGLGIPNVTGSGNGYPINDAYKSVIRDLTHLRHIPPLNNTKPGTTGISMQYLCTVPRRKNGGSLLISVLLADIVFLQTCWSLLSMIATWWLGRRDPLMNQCDACRSISIATGHNDTKSKLLCEKVTYGYESLSVDANTEL